MRRNIGGIQARGTTTESRGSSAWRQVGAIEEAFWAWHMLLRDVQSATQERREAVRSHAERGNEEVGP